MGHTMTSATIQNRLFGKCSFGLVLSLALVLLAARLSAQVEYVDPTIGNVGILLVPTRPAVYLPNSMVRVYPMRADAMDDRIESFPLTINSHRMDELFSIMPGDEQPRRLRPGKDHAVLLFHPLRRLADSDRIHRDRALRLLPLHLSQMAKPRSCWPTAWPAIWRRRAAAPSAAKSGSAT